MLPQRLGLGIFGGQLLVPLGGLPVGIGLGRVLVILGRLGQGIPIGGHAFVGRDRRLGRLFVGIQKIADLFHFGGHAGHARMVARGLARGVQGIGGLGQLLFGLVQGFAVAGQGIAPDGLGGQQQPAFHGHGQIGPWQAHGLQGPGPVGQDIESGGSEKPQ